MIPHKHINYSFRMESQKMLFTKLPLDELHTHSQFVAHSLVDTLFEKTHSQLQDKAIQNAQIHLLTRELTDIEVNTVKQAYPYNPGFSLMAEDASTKSHIVERKRPMSAKINHNYKPIPQTKPPLLKNKNASKRSYLSIPSSKTINTELNKSTIKGKRYQKQNSQNLFFPVPTNNDDSLINEEVVGQMRKKKIKEGEIEQEKMKFFKTVASEQQKNIKANKRWIQLMGSKTYYYNPSGQAVQVSKISKVSKRPKTTVNFKPQTQKRFREPHTSKSLLNDGSKPENIYVSYNSKQSPYRNNSETFVLDQNPKTLFYPSVNCKYQILN